MIRFTHREAPQGNQTFHDAHVWVGEGPGREVYAVDAMQAAGELLVWLAGRYPEAMQAAARYHHVGGQHLLAVAALEEAERLRAAQDTPHAKGE